MNRFRTGRFQSKWSFALHRQRAVILTAVSAVALTIAAISPWNAQPRLGWWTWLDAACSVATLSVALLVWWGELTENWEQSLPKRLRVVFEFDHQPVMICENAPLSSEADLRALAQQIGRQMNGNQDLKLRPFLYPSPPRIDHTEEGPVRHYDILVTLRELPESIQDKRRLDPLVCKIWRIANGVEQEVFQSRAGT